MIQIAEICVVATAYTPADQKRPSLQFDQASLSVQALGTMIKFYHCISQCAFD